MATERKQVLKVGDTIDELDPVANAPTSAIGGTVHGDIDDLTEEGVGFYEAPVNTVAPAVTGTAQVGQTLSCTAGTWTTDENVPISGYAYQWKDDGVAIAGATSSTYELQAAEEGGVITCVVTATSPAGSTEQVSNATSAVIAA